MSADKQFVHALVKKNSVLKEVYDEHIKDNDELLPHVFMGDFTRKIVELDKNIRNKKAGGAEIMIVKNIMDDLERWMTSGNNEVKELIIVSFIENLIDYENKEYIKIYFGKALLDEYEKIIG